MVFISFKSLSSDITLVALKSGMVRGFTPQESTNTTGQGFYSESKFTGLPLSIEESRTMNDSFRPHSRGPGGRACNGSHVPQRGECLELLAYKDHKKQTDFKSVLPTMFSLIACAQGTAFPPNSPVHANPTHFLVIMGTQDILLF